MFKRIATFAVAAALSVSAIFSMSVCATENEELNPVDIPNTSSLTSSVNTASTIEYVMGFSGTLYLSDWIDGVVIIKDIKPVLNSTEALSAASYMEYNTISAFEDNIYTKSGAELDLSSLAWYIDTEIKFVAAKLSNGEYRIINILVK